MIVGICKETFPGERRVAIIPDVIPSLAQANLQVIVESGAGVEAGIADSEYEIKGAEIVHGRRDVFRRADVMLQVRSLGSNPDAGREELELLRQGQVIIGFSEPLTSLEETKLLADAGVTSYSMELMPRITRAQRMDALSSMATVSGYKSVILAAEHLPKMFPMFMTAAGTVRAAKVFVIGAGVAGLQAAATAKRLGAVVSAYDIRPVVKEQVESVGARFVEMSLQTEDTEAKGGYARAMDEEFYRRQQELMTETVSTHDVVIATAAVPGRKAPILITEDMVKAMPAGSVLVDLAAERGGNCECTQQGQTIVLHDVTIIGPENLASSVPYHASQMYAKNITTFLLHLIEDGNVRVSLEDEVQRATLVTHGGEVVQPQVRDLLGFSTNAATQKDETNAS